MSSEQVFQLFLKLHSLISVKTELNNIKKIKKKIHTRTYRHTDRPYLTNQEWPESLERQKYGTWLAWLNHFENDINISKSFWNKFPNFSILGFLMNFRDFRVFVFGYRAQNENLEITENLYVWVRKVRIHADMFFDHYFNFLSAKNWNKQKWTQLKHRYGLEALIGQICSTWLGIWLKHFEIYVIWRTSQLLFETTL